MEDLPPKRPPGSTPSKTPSSDQAPVPPPSNSQDTDNSAQSEQDLDVDLTGDSAQSGVSTEPIPSKEGSARKIAMVIVWIFGASLCLLIILGFVLLFWLRWAPDKVDVIFNKGVIPFVEKVGTFATTVFGPLLAFILGYYFGEKSHGDSKR